MEREIGSKYTAPSAAVFLDWKLLPQSASLCFCNYFMLLFPLLEQQWEWIKTSYMPIRMFIDFFLEIKEFGI